jgi:hypothetical protein
MGCRTAEQVGHPLEGRALGYGQKNRLGHEQIRQDRGYIRGNLLAFTRSRPTAAA